ncbi:MAG: alpha/beta hydrolase [Bacteroidota bacterium]
MKLYFISGLGADERVFQFLHLPGMDKTFIQWIEPKKNESIPAYAARLSEQIDFQQEVVLIGISFGGIIAQEIAKQFPCKKTIIISSIKSHKEFSLSLLLVRFTQIHKLFSASVLKWSNTFTADYYFSTESTGESNLLHRIIQDTNDTFLIWAIQQLMQWKGDGLDRQVIHIHGTTDRIFPIGSIKGAIRIDQGGHFMIVNKSTQVSAILLEELSRP